MAARPTLYVLFTMNIEPPGGRNVQDGPPSWSVSAQAIDGFATRLLRAGFPPTMFIAPICATEHDPLLEEVGRRGAELALFLHPPHLGDGRFNKTLGQYHAADQRDLIDYAAERFADVFGHRPRSFRSGMFSASDETFQILYDLGFHQSSISEPGRALTNRAAEWTDTLLDPHYVNASHRKQAGDLRLLEIPVTSEPERELIRGIPPALQIESGTFSDMLQPLLRGRIERFEREQVGLPTLCFYTSNRFDYYTASEKQTQSLEAIIDMLLDEIAEHYTIAPVTAAGFHEVYRQHTRLASA
jgi:hypothetical protein